MTNENVISNRSEEPTNFSPSASEQSGLPQTERNVREDEEEIKLQGRLALLELETSGKQYFKPKLDTHYFLMFNRSEAVRVRGTPSATLKRKVQDKNDKNIIQEVPVTEFVHEVTHENGNTQTWSITSKELAAKILNTVMQGYSTIEFWKEKTGQKDTDVKYNVKGVLT